MQGEVPQPPPAEDCIPLAVWRNGSFIIINLFEEMEPYDRLLFLVPLSQFKTGGSAPNAQSAAVPVTFLVKLQGGWVLEEKAMVPDVGADDQNGRRVDLRSLRATRWSCTSIRKPTRRDVPWKHKRFAISKTRLRPRGHRSWV